MLTGCGQPKEPIAQTMNQMTKDYILQTPGFTTYTGKLDKLGIESVNYQIPYESDAYKLQTLEMLKSYKEQLEKYKDKKLTESEANQKALIMDVIDRHLEGEAFIYHDQTVDHLWGIHIEIPSYFGDSFIIESKEDVERFLKELAETEKIMKTVIEDAKVREEKGIIPPKYLIRYVSSQCKDFIKVPPEQNRIYINFLEKLEKIEALSKGEKDQLASKVLDILQNNVYSGYKDFMAYTKELSRSKNAIKAGVWELPQGDDFYAYKVKYYTTTDLTPEEIHQIGLKEVERIKNEIIELKKGTKYESVEIPQCFNVEGKMVSTKDQLNEYGNIIKLIEGKLPELFNIEPINEIIIKEAPANRYGNYYRRPSIDLSHTGTFYTTLYEDIPRAQMMPLAFHEGIPGHHMQLSLQMTNQEIPVLAKVNAPTSFVEGWALYAERLADELGLYTSVEEQLIYYQSELFRAARLVVDTGLHYKQWTRQEAILYMMEVSNKSEGEIKGEVDRYMINPGQACAYKIGQLKIVELRRYAQEQLGENFDIKEFHHQVLKNGGITLSRLENNIQQWVNEQEK